MKSFRSSLLLLGLIVVLTGCGISSSKDTNNSGKDDNNKESVVIPEGAKPKSESEKKYSASAVGTHNTKDSCWEIIGGKVYDMTAFIPDHPGGPEKVISWCGKEATAAFDGMPKHSRDKLEKFLLGDLEE